VLKPVTIQALVRTISSASEEDLSSFVGRFDPRTGLTDNRLLYHYLELWTAIFSTGAPRKLASVVKEEQGIGSVEVLQIGKPSGKSDSIASLVTSSQGAASLQVVFNELMSNVISIIHRLDLSFEAKSDYDGLGELNSKGQPHNSKDCALFHNLITMVETILQVRFGCRVILPSCRAAPTVNVTDILHSTDLRSAFGTFLVTSSCG